MKTISNKLIFGIVVCVVVVYLGYGVIRDRDNVSIEPRNNSMQRVYRNETYGFEFSYPNHYEVNSNSRTNIAPTVSSDYVDIQIHDYYGVTEIENLGENIVISGVEGVKLPIGGSNRDGGIEYEIHLPKKSLTIFFSGKNPDSYNYIYEYDQILSTFKFK